jgi:hypothetical protein
MMFVPLVRPKWRNWQTRWIQNPVRFTPREGSSPSFGTYQKRTCDNCRKSFFRFSNQRDLSRLIVHVRQRTHPRRVVHTVTTTLPICWFDSRKRWASTISSSGNVLLTIGLRLPSDKPSMTNALAFSSRAGSLVISIIT